MLVRDWVMRMNTKLIIGGLLLFTLGFLALGFLALGFLALGLLWLVPSELLLFLAGRKITTKSMTQIRRNSPSP